MVRKLFVVALLLVALVAPVFAADPPPAAPAAKDAAACSDTEVKAEVPALSAFHEVIYPLWHDAWPNKNLGLMRELLPQIKEHVATLQKTALPGILRDKTAKWDEGVAGVAASTAKLETALAANAEQASLDAAESLHAGFEGLVRTIRPRMAELDAYHQVLYRVYHYDWPQKNVEALKANAAEMATRCAALGAAPVPKRFAESEPKLRAAFAALCTATGELTSAAAGSDTKALGAAVEKVHTSYLTCEALFE